MNSIKTISVICLIVLIALIISIIKSNGFFGVKNPNTRWFIKGNLKFWANLNIKERRYTVLDIGTPERPFYKKHPRFRFKLNNQLVFKSNIIDVKELRKISERITDPNKYEKKWPDGAELIYFKGYAITVLKDSVLNFYAQLIEESENNSYIPEIGNIETENMYPFPLSHEQVVKIFGDPERIEEFFRL